MGSPRITVIVPAYNAETYIEDCLRSIQSQSFTDFVCKVYDDGSQDRTWELAQRFADSDSRFQVIPGKNWGTPRRVAQAYSDVISEFFCQVDADDLIAPDALRLTHMVLSGCPQHVGVVYSDYQRINQDGSIDRDDPHFKSRCRTTFSLRHMQTKGFCAFQFRLIRTSAYLASISVDPSLPTAEDFDLVLKLAERTQFVHLPQVLYFYRQHNGQSSKKNPSHLEAVCKRLMDDSYKRKSSPAFALALPYTGVDDSLAIRRWTQLSSSVDVLIGIITEFRNDPDVLECQQYSQHRVEVIKCREIGTDYAALVSQMVRGVPSVSLDEAFVPSEEALEDLVQGYSIPVLELEPRSSWLLQSGALQSDALRPLAQNSGEIVGDGEPGNSALYRLTREDLP